jgi:hypothetical protein
MPVAGCCDKTGRSSFAHAVAELRARTGRLDPSIGAQAWRCDFGAVGLYAPGDPWDADRDISRGVARYFPLLDAHGQANLPPKTGLPKVGTTLDLSELVDRLIATALGGSALSVQYAPAEGETEGVAPVTEEALEEALVDLGEDDEDDGDDEG